jgi:ketosteroid isomerase-like protein
VLIVATAWPAAGAPPSGGDVPADEAAIRALEEEERVAVLKQDFGALERLWSAEFIVNTPRNDVSRDRAAVLALFRKGIVRYASFDRTIEVIRFSGDHAFVMGGETVRPAGDAPNAGKTITRRFTNVWRREGGAWRLFARHAGIVAVAQ